MTKLNMINSQSPPKKWSISLFTQIIRRSQFFRWHYRKAAKSGKALSQHIASHNIPITDPWKGDANKGQPLATGITPLIMLEQRWHDFAWLRDMREYGGQNARTYARRYLLDWIMQHGIWEKATWHPIRLAQRIRSLILTWSWYGQSAPESQQIQILTSLIIQSGFLQKDLSRLTDNDDRLNAYSAILMDIAFRQPDADISTLTSKIFATLDELLMEDGCHVSRRIDKHMTCLGFLHDMRYALAIIQKTQTEADITDHLARLDQQIAMMGAIGRMWRLGDNALLAMRHGMDAPPILTELVLDKSGPRGKICQHATQGGFMRMASGRSVVVMNTAPTRNGNLLSPDADADAAANAIEFSFQKQRILISSGYHHDLMASHPHLADLMKGTSAHSTLSIDMINSSQITELTSSTMRAPAMAGRNSGHMRAPRQAIATKIDYGPASGGSLAVAEHNGYQSLFGALHERKLYLATGGHILKGQDIIRYTGDPGNIPSEAIIRFHLHPRIHASQTNNRTILLKLPANMPSWKFICSEGHISLEDSITAINGHPQRCQQIVISVALSELREHMKLETSWGFVKLARKQVKPV